MGFQITFDQLKELLQGAPNVTLLIDIVGDTPVKTPVPDDQPKTMLIEMTDGEAFKTPSGFDKAGKPILDKTIVGFRAEKGERYLVLVDFVTASGGSRYYEVWIGEDADTTAQGWFVEKARTKKV